MHYEGTDQHVKRTSMGKLRSCILGALNGAFYSATMLLIIWRLRAAADEQNIAEGEISGDYIHLVSNERWSSIVIIWVVAFTLVTLIVGSIWRKGQKSSILFWGVVGVVAVAAWNAFAIFGAWLDKQYAGDTMTYSWVTSWRNPMFGPISLAVVILVNLVYGYLVRSVEPNTK